MPASDWLLGWSGPGFAFDNELMPQKRALAAYSIDREAVSWARYLPFLEATGAPPPRYLRQTADGWQRQVFGSWEPLPPDAPATHLRLDEAEAWCRWAGRRLPSEAEWECAAVSAEAMNEDFDWGQVWEWTASPFVPYPGFEAHPYRDYSMPWFDGRPVLRGASFATAAGMKHPRYRNYFPAERNDLFTGFRTCAR